MSISPLAMAAKKVIDAAFVNGPAYDLASVAAFALESACLLQDPETAAEQDLAVETARHAVAVAESSVAMMRREHAENARLRERITELEVELYTEQAHSRTFLEQRNAHAKELLELRPKYAELQRQVVTTPYTPTPEAHAQMRTALTGYSGGKPSTDSEPDALTRLLAPTQALREDEDPCHPCGCPKRFDRHADGCPTYRQATGCGDGPDQWCGGCSACKCEPHTKGCVKASAPR